MKISVSDEKKRVEEQRRLLEENIADFQVGSRTLLGGAATCSEGLVICFPRVPLACLGCMAAALQPKSLGNSQETVYKTFGTSSRPTQ